MSRLITAKFLTPGGGKKMADGRKAQKVNDPRFSRKSGLKNWYLPHHPRVSWFVHILCAPARPEWCWAISKRASDWSSAAPSAHQASSSGSPTPSWSGSTYPWFSRARQCWARRCSWLSEPHTSFLSRFSIGPFHLRNQCYQIETFFWFKTYFLFIWLRNNFKI